MFSPKNKNAIAMVVLLVLGLFVVAGCLSSEKKGSSSGELPPKPVQPEQPVEETKYFFSDLQPRDYQRVILMVKGIEHKNASKPALKPDEKVLRNISVIVLSLQQAAYVLPLVSHTREHDYFKKISALIYGESGKALFPDGDNPELFYKILHQ